MFEVIAIGKLSMREAIALSLALITLSLGAIALLNHLAHRKSGLA